MQYEERQYLQELTKSQQLDIMKSNFFSCRKLNTTIIEDGYVLPPIDDPKREQWLFGGVLNTSKEYIETSGQYAVGEKNRVCGKYNFDENNVEYLDEEVVYLNYFIPHWGHYLLDVIGRLWYVLNNKEVKIVYTYKLNKDLKIVNNYLELLHLLGINDNRIIFINKITKVRKVIIPDTSVCITDYFTVEYKNIIDSVVSKALEGSKLNGNRKIYCSRRNFKKAVDKEIGEDRIEEIFKNNGYEIVHMEDYSLLDQIKLLNDSKEIVCVSGTLVHNAMFIRNDKCKFTVLNKSYKLNPNIYLTNQLSSASFRFVDCYLSPLPIYTIGRGPFMLRITKELLEYFNDNGFDTSEVSIRINYIDVLKYYILFLKKNNKKIIRHENYETNVFSIYDVSTRKIRNHFYKQLFN